MSRGDIALVGRSTPLQYAEPSPSDAPATNAAPTGSRTQRSRGGGVGQRLPYWPALDGLRAVALFWVLAYHAGIDGFEGSYLGISGFFVLSGFLITSLVLVERERHGAVSLSNFWSRRLRRLMPAALIGLAGITVIGATIAGGDQLARLRGDVLSTLAYVANWRLIFSGSGYVQLFQSPSPVQHFWSLAIEEQFYLIFPLVIVGLLALSKGSRRALGLALVGIVVVSTTLMMLFYNPANNARAYMGTDTRMAEIAIGCLLGVLLCGRTDVARLWARKVLEVVAIGIFGVVLFLYSTVHIDAPWIYHGGIQLIAVGFAVVVWAATQRNGILVAVLALPPLVWLGRISYGVYIFHWPIYLWLSESRTGLDPVPLFGLRLAVTLLAAWASFKFIESPVRRGARVTSWRPFIAVPVAVAAVAAGVIFVTADPPAARISLGHQSTNVAAITGKDPVRMYWTGDSVAQSMSLGLKTWAEKSGAMAMADNTMVGCGVARGGLVRALGYEKRVDPECDARFDLWPAALADYRPDVVGMLSVLWDLGERKIPDDGNWRHVGDPVLDDYVSSELGTAADILGSTGATVVWFLAPQVDPHYIPELIMGKPPYAEADPARVARYNELIREMAATRPFVVVADFPGYLDTLPGGQLAENLRPDGAHFSPASTLEVGKWAGPLLDASGLAAKQRRQAAASAPATGRARES